MNENIEEKLSYNVIRIIRGTTVDGPGFRTSIYLAGCSHNCLGCHNPQSHDPRAGEIMSLKDIMAVVEEEDFDVTITGGDPLFDPASILPLLKELKNNRRNIWIYTGYTWEDIIKSPILLYTISHADVVVDGPFLMELKNPDIRFRGSSNQRIIDIKASLDEGKVKIWSD